MDHPEDSSKELPEFQRTVASFAEEHGIEAPIHVRLLDLSSEAGELSKEYLENTNYGREPFEGSVGGWQNEIGDVLFSLVCLANSTSVNLESALQGSLDKYEDRLQCGGAGSRGGDD